MKKLIPGLFGPASRSSSRGGPSGGGALLAVIAAETVLFAAVAPGFFTLGNFFEMTRFSVELGLLAVALTIPTGALLLARRNLRLGRGDRKGAFRVAAFVFASYGKHGYLAENTLAKAMRVVPAADAVWDVRGHGG